MSLLEPKEHARIIAAVVRFDGVTEAEGGIDVMLLLCKVESVPKVSHRNHRRILDPLRASAEPNSFFAPEMV